MFRLFWPVLLMLVIPASASVQVASLKTSELVLYGREQRLWTGAARASEFGEMLMPARCEDTQPPEALTTPDPLMVQVGPGKGVKISFIVGADGRVHSPLILQSAGWAYDRNVLQTVRSWRYRPATCNGVPTESETKIQFSHR